jgi:HSP20 family protein
MKEDKPMMLRRIHGNEPAFGCGSEFDRLFNQVFRGANWNRPEAGNPRVFPALNVWEDAEKVFVEAELPGFKMDELEIYVTGDELTIKGNRAERQEEGVSFHRQERGFGAFSRALRLPVEADSERVEATLRDGVLTIALPKTPAAMPRKIEVKG